MMKRKKILYVVIICVMLALVGGVSYALLFFSETGEQNKIKTGEIHFNFVESDTNIDVSLNDALSDAEGKASENYFDLTLSSSATGVVDVGYYIYLTITENESNIPDSGMMVYLTRVDTVNDIEVETEVVPATAIGNLTKFDIDNLIADNTATNYDLYNNYFSFNNNSAIQSVVYRFRIWPNATGIESAGLRTIEDGLGNHQATQGSAYYKVKLNAKVVDGQPKTL